MVWATLIPLRAVTDPPPNLLQLTLPVMVTPFESAFMDDSAAGAANAANGLARTAKSTA
jgi:hypothetical protein